MRVTVISIIPASTAPILHHHEGLQTRVSRRVGATYRLVCDTRGFFAQLSKTNQQKKQMRSKQPFSLSLVGWGDLVAHRSQDAHCWKIRTRPIRFALHLGSIHIRRMCHKTVVSCFRHLGNQTHTHHVTSLVTRFVRREAQAKQKKKLYKLAKAKPRLSQH